jgi:hypothetical protein
VVGPTPAPIRLSRVSAPPIEVTTEAPALVTVSAVSTTAPATARRKRRAALLRAVDAMLVSSAVRVGLLAVRTDGANGSAGASQTSGRSGSGSSPW